MPRSRKLTLHDCFCRAFGAPRKRALLTTALTLLLVSGIGIVGCAPASSAQQEPASAISAQRSKAGSEVGGESADTAEGKTTDGAGVGADSAKNSQNTSSAKAKNAHLGNKSTSGTVSNSEAKANPSAANNSSGTSGDPTASTAMLPIATPANSGALQVRGSQLCNSAGDPVQLRGVSTHGLAWYPQYVNEQFFTELREVWGANVVRLALYTAESGGYCTDGDKEALFELVEDGIEYATRADLYVIADWHILSDTNPLDYQDDAADFFSRLSSQMADHDNVIYEICNEPNGSATWDDIAEYAQRIIPLIRANDPDAVILVGTPTWSQEIDKALASPLDFDNIMYTLHFYAATHKDDLRQRLQAVVEAGLPVFVSEFGICDASGNGQIDYASADAWVQLMDSLNVSYICWNLSNKNETSALFKSDCEKTSGFEATDLSEEGLWLQNVLHGEVPGGSAKASSTPSNSSTSSHTESALNAEGANAAAANSSVHSSGTTTSPQTASGTTGNFAWTATLQNSWEANGLPFSQYDTTITNTGTTTEPSWQITVPFAGPFQLSDSWNGQFSVEGNQLTIASLDYNATLPPGESAQDVGFIVSGNPIASE